VDAADKNANIMAEKLATGEVENIHEVFVASQKAELTLNMAIEVKNKVVEAYKEIMRLQL
jgi:flagellar hook-basal body complex protein FliE